MDELVKLVTEKVGIGPDQAQKAVETVLGFLKERLPEPIAGQLDNIVAGGGAGGLDLGGLGDALGGFMGKK